MGTRHLIIVYHEGKLKLAQYGQLDGYPEVQGARVLAFVSDPGNIAKLAANLDKLYAPTKEQLRDLEQRIKTFKQEAKARMKQLMTSTAMNNDEYSDLMNKTMRPEVYICPSLSLYTSAGILGLVANAEGPVMVLNEPEFMFDWQCEWAYAVDLDAEVLEVYSQGSHEETDKILERFHEVENPSVKEKAEQKEKQEKEGEIIGPVLRASWKFSELPTKSDFLETVRKAVEVEEEEEKEDEEKKEEEGKKVEEEEK